MKKLKIKYGFGRELVEYIAILMIVLSSGSMYFTIMNVQNTLYFLLFVAAVTAAVCKISANAFKRNLVVYFVILGCVALNLFINIEYAVLDNNIFILLIRLTSLLLIQSSVTDKAFIQKYVKILYVLSIISLISFFYMVLIGYHLPFLIEKNHNGIDYFYTFYHTVGYRTVYARNAGIFWEAPAFAIFITIAFVFMVTRPDLFPKMKNNIRYYVVFIVTIATTLSVYAFFYIGIIGLLMLVSSKGLRLKNTAADYSQKKKKRDRYYIIGFFVMIMVFMLIENNYHLISYKLIDRQGSYETRFNDTYYSLILASENLITGYGVFNNYTVDWLRMYGVINNSNGLAILLIATGLPMFLLAVVRVGRSLKQLLNLSGWSFWVVMLLFFLFHFSEHLWLYTLFIGFLFRYKDRTD